MTFHVKQVILSMLNFFVLSNLFLNGRAGGAICNINVQGFQFYPLPVILAAQKLGYAV